jgi:hypothetical protein
MWPETYTLSSFHTPLPRSRPQCASSSSWHCALHHGPSSGGRETMTCSTLMSVLGRESRQLATVTGSSPEVWAPALWDMVLGTAEWSALSSCPQASSHASPSPRPCSEHPHRGFLAPSEVMSTPGWEDKQIN